jgi:hypothetical protein
VNSGPITANAPSCARNLLFFLLSVSSFWFMFSFCYLKYGKPIQNTADATTKDILSQEESAIPILYFEMKLESPWYPDLNGRSSHKTAFAILWNVIHDPSKSRKALVAPQIARSSAYIRIYCVSSANWRNILCFQRNRELPSSPPQYLIDFLAQPPMPFRRVSVRLCRGK